MRGGCTSEHGSSPRSARWSSARRLEKSQSFQESCMPTATRCILPLEDRSGRANIDEPRQGRCGRSAARGALDFRDIHRAERRPAPEPVHRRRGGYGRAGLPRAGGTPRADGAGGLPPDTPTPAGCGRRLPGDVPGPGAEGPFDPRGRLARPLAARRGLPDGPSGAGDRVRVIGPPTSSRWRKPPTRRRTARSSSTSGPCSTRSWPGCRASTASRSCSATSRASRTRRRPGCSPGRSAPSAAGSRGAAGCSDRGSNVEAWPPRRRCSPPAG